MTTALMTAQRRLFEHRVDWGTIDRRKARAAPRVLDLLREACLVESYLPTYTAKMLALFWDDLDATATFTIEAMEAYSHFYLLRRYLEIVGHRPIRDTEVRALRRKVLRASYRDPIRELVNFMGTEHFAAHFFRSLAAQIDEPVMRRLLPEFAAEETAHSQLAFDLLAARVGRDGATRRRVVRLAARFTHVGAYVRPYVSPAVADNVRAINAFDRRFTGLLGRPLSAFLVEGKR